jgi:hypothetical protein
MDSFGDGCRIEPMAFSPGECDTLLSALEKTSRTGRAGARHMMSNDAASHCAGVLTGQALAIKPQPRLVQARDAFQEGVPK